MEYDDRYRRGSEVVVADVPYRIEKILGRGGFGIVFLGVPKSGPPLAIKSIHQDLRNIGIIEDNLNGARMTRLALPLSSDQFPKIVSPPVSIDSPIVATTFVEGSALCAETFNNRPATLERADVVLEIMCGLVEQIGLLMEAGVAHRDVSDTNVVVNERRVRLIDLDLLIRLDDRSNRNIGVQMGKLDTMSPEVLAGRGVSSTSDLYGAGRLALLLLGEPRASDFDHRDSYLIMDELMPRYSEDAQGRLRQLMRFAERTTRSNPAERPDTAKEALQILSDDGNITEV